MASRPPQDRKVSTMLTIHCIWRLEEAYCSSFILLLSTLTVVGTLISDVLLALLDPRIRYT